MTPVQFSGDRLSLLTHGRDAGQKAHCNI
jgi:hypothetical protein